MKQLVFLATLFLALSFTACEQDAAAVDNTLTEEALIEALVTDPDAEEVSFSLLPPAAVEVLANEHFETFVEIIERVPGRGFIIHLANGNTLYCREDGRFLEYRREFRPGAVFGRHPHGPCFARIVRFGHSLDSTELSESILTYITDNYPENNIRAAKAWGDSTLVFLSRATVLLFDGSGTFLKEWNPLEHCLDRCAPVRPATRATIEQYITDNYPEVELRRICRRAARIFVLAKEGEDRAIFIFDLQGNYLDRRP